MSTRRALFGTAVTIYVTVVVDQRFIAALAVAHVLRWSLP
jgi:hypothetical protein